jgi:hypothetical protein
VQFPNLPLIVALLAGEVGKLLDGEVGKLLDGEVGKLLDGSAHSCAASVSYLALTIWAYEELVHGVNWFRRLPGLAAMILLVVHLANALPA